MVRRTRVRSVARRRKSKSRSKRRNRSRKYSRRGGASPSYPIPMEIKYEIWTEMMKNFKDHPKLDEADAILEEMVYEPEYRSQFTGKSFEDRDDKEYWQGMDKIEAFFKYST